MTNEKLQMLLKRNASLSISDPGQVAAVECRASYEPLAAKEVQGQPRGRVLVVVTSVRKFDCDDDGICEKYIVDLLRRSRIIHDDSQKFCKIETSFQKAKKGEAERTEIDIYELIEP